MEQIKYLPGSLVRARRRDWVVTSSTESALYLRPVTGVDDESTVIIPALEPVPPCSSTFEYPDPAHYGNYNSLSLLKDSLLLKLRSGAGPFRSFGNIAVEPRAYQLVPLIMALRMQTIRLLIADDVGVGKTIEAALILREMIDRGEVSRAVVLCPPHLVEQWQSELSSRFHIEAVALTSRSAARLDKNVPMGSSLFDFYKFVIVSFDYVKSDTHRSNFIAQAPEFMIVDEAHTCASGAARQLRFQLLKQLCDTPERHVLLLTATPHSGDADGFYNLLSLLNPDFKSLSDDSDGARSHEALRKELASHFVQRRRVDIEEWHDTTLFPRRKTTELTYKLTGKWGEFFDEVQDYCRELAQQKAEQKGNHLMWYATLALLRCVSSSPAAAEKTLSMRGSEQIDDDDDDDGDGESLSNDLEPCLALPENARLEKLINMAGSLRGAKDDPKLNALENHVSKLVAENFRPVIFCRYIATAHYVKEHLQAKFPNHFVSVITGEFTPEEREVKIEAAGEHEKVILVATDCMSEGINLQENFNAVCHYDLCWNPTRHEQREGRVDRFGQKSPEVRCSLIYGENNPVDGFILNVILRKAETIKKELGIIVPIPQDREKINSALIKSVLMKKRTDSDRWKTASLFGDDFEYEREIIWRDTLELASKRHTIFAQKPLQPQQIMPEWKKQQEAIGGDDDVRRFVENAAAILGVPLEASKSGKPASGKPQSFVLAWGHFTGAGSERIKTLAKEFKFADRFSICFSYPAVEGAQFIHRSHPLVSLFSEILVENALDETKTQKIIARSAAIAADVPVVTSIFLLRLRNHLIYTKGRTESTLMSEEIALLCATGRKNPTWITDPEKILPLFSLLPKANVSDPQADINFSINMIKENQHILEELASERAKKLLEDHSRVREAVKASGKYDVSPCLPVDLMGVYVLLPHIG